MPVAIADTTEDMLNENVRRARGRRTSSSPRGRAGRGNSYADFISRESEPLSSGSLEDGTFRINPDQARRDPSAAQGLISKKEFELFEQEFRPGLDRALETALDEDFVENQGDAAGDRIRKVFDAQTGQTERRLSRFGASPTADQRRSLNRSSDLKRALAVAGGENTARRRAERTQGDLLEGLFDVGSSFLKTGGSSLSSAANMQSAREQANENAEAANEAQTISTIGTIAGIAMGL